mmetsp:Transcript_3828/g.6169  ORF Transcript_3828/g.6169 Transcript_3828/m.6169 type:complete len:188 (+) Transcript_3828:352-915(+)
MSKAKSTASPTPGNHRLAPDSSLPNSSLQLSRTGRHTSQTSHGFPAVPHTRSLARTPLTHHHRASALGGGRKEPGPKQIGPIRGYMDTFPPSLGSPGVLIQTLAQSLHPNMANSQDPRVSLMSRGSRHPLPTLALGLHHTLARAHLSQHPTPSLFPPQGHTRGNLSPSRVPSSQGQMLGYQRFTVFR